MRTLALIVIFSICSLVWAEDRLPVRGKIIQLNEPGGVTVKINAGEKQGVRRFDDCDVFRDDQRIGELHITAVAAEQSSAEITFVHPDFLLEVDDSILIDITSKFLHELSPDSKLKDPADAGRRFARADIRGKEKRILYFGKPWSVGKPLVDDESGLPVRIIAGCLVTGEFVEFVQAYNAEMRAAKESE